MHEHVMVDFTGADHIAPGRYDPEEVFRKALPHLRSSQNSALNARRRGAETGAWEAEPGAELASRHLS